MIRLIFIYYLDNSTSKIQLIFFIMRCLLLNFILIVILCACCTYISLETYGKSTEQFVMFRRNTVKQPKYIWLLAFCDCNTYIFSETYIEYLLISLKKCVRAVVHKPTCALNRRVRCAIRPGILKEASSFKDIETGWYVGILKDQGFFLPLGPCQLFKCRIYWHLWVRWHLKWFSVQKIQGYNVNITLRWIVFVTNIHDRKIYSINRIMLSS